MTCSIVCDVWRMARAARHLTPRDPLLTSFRWTPPPQVLSDWYKANCRAEQVRPRQQEPSAPAAAAFPAARAARRLQPCGRAMRLGAELGREGSALERSTPTLGSSRCVLQLRSTCRVTAGCALACPCAYVRERVPLCVYVRVCVPRVAPAGVCGLGAAPGGPGRAARLGRVPPARGPHAVQQGNRNRGTGTTRNREAWQCSVPGWRSPARAAPSGSSPARVSACSCSCSRCKAPSPTCTPYRSRRVPSFCLKGCVRRVVSRASHSHSLMSAAHALRAARALLCGRGGARAGAEPAERAHFA